MGFIYIFFSVSCSLAIAQILKVAENNRMRVMNILVINYLAGALISIFNSAEFETVSLSVTDHGFVIGGMMVILGLIFIGNLVAYSRSIDRVGMGVSIAAMRMSLIFPIAVSLFIFNEELASIRYLGIVIALGALLLMVPKIKTKNISGISDAWLPVLIFMMTGAADSSLKIYERLFSTQLSEELFVSGIFIISFLTGMGILMKRGELHFTFKEIGYGIATGIVNLYSSIFLIYALKLMPGSVVFPIVNVSLVILGTLIGVWIWKDTPTVKQWSGLAAAVISIILLIG